MTGSGNVGGQPSRRSEPRPPPSALRAALDGIGYPDADAAQAAKLRQDELTKPAGALGMLEELSIWASSVQGQCPPHAFERTRVVVFAGDHGITAAGVSAYPAEVTAQMLANIAAGGAAVNVLAAAAGAGVRALDLSVDHDTDPALSQAQDPPFQRPDRPRGRPQPGRGGAGAGRRHRHRRRGDRQRSAVADRR